MTSDFQELQQETPNIPDTLPVLPLRGTLIFPHAVAPLLVGQPRSVRLVDDVMRGNRMLALAAQKGEVEGTPGPDQIYRTGTAAIIHQLARGQDGTLRLMVQGLERIRITDFTSTDPYMVARIERTPEQSEPTSETEPLRRAVLDLFRKLVDLIDEIPDELVGVVEGLERPREVAYMVASASPLSVEERQEVLEIDSVDQKLRRLVQILQHQISVRELGRQITSETQERMTKAQREYFLREQLKSIQKQLGEGEEDSEIGQLRKQLQEANLPEEARREAERELSRLASISQASPEYGMVRTYLEWMVGLPWNTLTGSDIDVKRAAQVLDEDHYDLEKIKDRILEYLAVKKLRQEREEVVQTPSTNGRKKEGLSQTPADSGALEPILCFVGPPGVGKTSLGQSIARALGRKFIRSSLGGVHDEAEIRGHRRTYIGAMPGRIIQALKRVETRDPVFMLDEIDKVGADWRGDPSSALLEVLDPAQNHSFSDNYLGVPFDLSQVLFIATANTLDTVPPPLRDRMEVLELSGYTDEEKVQIAQQFLVPRQLRAHGLKKEELSFTNDSIRQIVRSYTREAGVRNLERNIAAICRKVAREVASGVSPSISVTPEQVETYLDRPKFFDEVTERTTRPGVATGLAWTPVGGDVLFVEATMMPSKEEKLVITGMLGEVMRESAQAALSYVRSNAQALGISPNLFEGKTIHLHVPAGAVPKDGPSAGITMATALASLATGRPIRSDLAMTGEITLRGRVLPVGGIKEKVLAAHRAGIKTVILPKRNEQHLDDVPKELREQMDFILVETIDEVFSQALEPVPTEAGVA